MDWASTCVNGFPKGLNVNMKNNSHNDTEDDKLNHVIIKDGN